MKIKLTSIIMILLIVLFSDLRADDRNVGATSGGDFEKIGAAGGQFLKIGVGARATGMAGAYGAIANDLSAIHWNPAGIAEIDGMAAEFDHTWWFAGFTHDFAAIALPLGDNYRVAAHFLNFGAEGIPITTIRNPSGTGNTYSVNDVTIGLTFSGYLTEQFSFGVTGKFVNQAFSTLDASGIAFDVGTKYETGLYGISLAFSMHNLGTKFNYEGTELETSKQLYDAAYASRLDASYDSYPYSLPLIFRAGIASRVYETEEHLVTAALDFVTLSDIPEQFALGGEYTWSNLVTVRAGYITGQDQFGFSGGVGLKYNTGGINGIIDYSISPTATLGLVNRLSVKVGLGS